ncbi:NAD(P)-binding protein [Poronia punctata]|nr:NAD(P)-binding protein [Poronia punctata]
MVSLSKIRTSNALLPTILPPNPVAVFVGATSGIGEATLKKFAQYTTGTDPRVYFIGRSVDAGGRIAEECRVLNPKGKYTFLQADVSLLRVVDEVCEEIKAVEEVVNLLFLTCGVASFDKSKTPEDIHLLAALNYYSRIRFTSNLLPQLRKARGLRRVVTVGGGSQEGALDTTDFPALKQPVEQIRGHLTSLVSLGFEGLARGAPEVSFVHDYPGTVRTKLVISHLPEDMLRNLTFLPIDECGERQLYMATSAKFPPKEEADVAGVGAGVPLQDGEEVVLGVSGARGSGMYSVGVDCESAPSAVLELLAEMRQRGLVDAVWEHTQSEFERVAALASSI